ncbi:FAD-binding oxidoreductase [Nocardioides sp. cx-173]|uniref:NAD(P)/FAD-dependent oxidoreductase n=1 Tax=Nocardioides sp. cx-173 TaxID=2898796 RepID=UPI001E57DC7F|nr:FAD-dependent oxidoreductase [Nocardioides sp. cx-173]MCD4524835.1 FAD-binding oxidoreductase [Nocardioides sp. cx-173]UGB43341.1 FAD-binding oxidoreductase [Nocardioides sp. cx-173]
MTTPAAALAAAAPSVFWLDDAARPGALPPLAGRVGADLVVVGGGYAGLWTALRAVERDPGRSVVVLEAGRCGQEASGRNGGFASASLTHGFANGLARWPTELATLDRLGADNLRAIGDTVARHGIDCHWEETGELSVAAAPHQLAELEELAAAMTAAGHEVALLDRTAVRQRLDSPTYVGGLADPHGTALVEPARLAWGLRRACLDLGVRIFEDTRATALGDDGAGIVVSTTGGSAHAGQVALATNAFPSLLRRLRLRTVPVYDHVLMTEPLSAAQLASIGWAGREGVGDSANLFHYLRLTRDDRILWGGYDAVYHYGSRIARDLEQSDRTHGLLAEHFFATFPQLEGLRFTHRWGGVIDTCTRFAAFFGTARAGRVGYALGYTGLGVAATRFGADVVLDLLDGEETERTALEMVRRRPPPFPPEPARYAGIQLTRWSLARADRHDGRRNVWLRALDAAGLGFDS